MIERTNAYKVGELTFGTLEQAQRHEIEELLKAHPEEKDIQIDIAADLLVKKREQVIDILTTGPRSKPKARSLHGGKKTRWAKLEAPVAPQTH